MLLESRNFEHCNVEQNLETFCQEECMLVPLRFIRLATALSLAATLGLMAAAAYAQTELRFFADDPAIVYRGEWEPGPAVPGERPARLARFSGAAAVLTYSGPWISWLTSVGPDRGKVRVTIDGQVRDDDLDLYNPTPAEKEFRWSTLTTATNHIIEISVLGDRNEASSGTLVVNRGFLAPAAPVPPTLTAAAPAEAQPPAAEATPQPQPQAPIPVQVAPGVSFYLATDPAITYSTEWQTVPPRPASRTLPALPSLRSAEARPATVGFMFYGPSVTWYTLVGPDRGKVRVAIDGEVRDEEIDLYSPQEQIRAFAWSVLDPTRLHRIEITVLQDRNPSSQGVQVDVLAFATPRAPLPPMAPAI
jgi:hypothetical protein